jgi:hypothetical protein
MKGIMEDIVPIITITASVIGIIYFLIEFQFKGLKESLKKYFSSLIK